MHSGGSTFESESRIGIPLTPLPAREIIAELFERNPRQSTAALIEEVPRRWRRTGGVNGKDAIKRVINKALLYMKDDGLVQRIGYGQWLWLGGDAGAGDCRITLIDSHAPVCHEQQRGGD